MRYNNAGFDGSNANTIIFIDYGNLHEVLRRRAPSGTDLHEILLELIEDVCRNLTDRKRSHATAVAAYADFSAFSGEGVQVQHRIGSLGIEPRFVSNAVQPNAVELQIAVEVTNAVLTRPGTGAVVILSGDRLYLPLLQLARQHGRRVHMVLLDRTPESHQLPFLQENFDDVSALLGPEKRRLVDYDTISQAGTWVHRNNGHSTASTADSEPDDEPVHRHLTDSLCKTALEIIDEYFGQYDEIYLTPLLRKLSEALGEENCDPKALISELEHAGAVWLEKRRGFPYDYTVLIVDRDHPDMLRILGEERPRSLSEGDGTYRMERPTDHYSFD